MPKIDGAEFYTLEEEVPAGRLLDPNPKDNFKLMKTDEGWQIVEEEGLESSAAWQVSDPSSQPHIGTNKPHKPTTEPSTETPENDSSEQDASQVEQNDTNTPSSGDNSSKKAATQQATTSDKEPLPATSDLANSRLVLVLIACAVLAFLAAIPCRSKE